MARDDDIRLLEALRERERRLTQRRFHSYFPEHDTITPDGLHHARHKYPRHLEFFEAGKSYREVCFMAANRVGKTLAGAYQVACHLTGMYPDWWPGRRFDRPVRFWAAGKTNETTRDIVQSALLGDIEGSGATKRLSGTGLVLGEKLGRPTWKQGVPDLVDSIPVKHVSGRNSILGFKSYQQGRGSFEGTAQHGIWLDEEPPMDVYGECLMRTATTGGVVLMTFTPLEGMSETVLQFMPQDQRPDMIEA
jgi:phage terminase large subunit-like protein